MWQGWGKYFLDKWVTHWVEEGEWQLLSGGDPSKYTENQKESCVYRISKDFCFLFQILGEIGGLCELWQNIFPKSSGLHTRLAFNGSCNWGTKWQK